MLWAVIVGFLLAFLLGFGMGANDVSNAFGTSVGSKALTVIQAYVLATVFESLGALTIGFNVMQTMGKEVVKHEQYANRTDQLMIGQLSILGGGASWLLIATFANLPISVTHSIVGATLGFGIYHDGVKSVHWHEVGRIAASWVVSPVFSGIISAILCVIVDHTVLRRKDPFKAGIFALPFFFAISMAVAVYIVGDIIDRQIMHRVGHWPSMGLWIATAATAIISVIVVKFALVPWLIKQDDKLQTQPLAFLKELSLSAEPAELSGSVSESSARRQSAGGGSAAAPARSDTSVVPSEEEESVEEKRSREEKEQRRRWFRWFMPLHRTRDDLRTLRLFNTLQIFTACFAGFAHGANDVGNSIAPLSNLMSLHDEERIATSINKERAFLLVGYGVVAMVVGLWALGHRVIHTVGTNMTEINPASGFIIEFGAAVVALTASHLSIPISTTHCVIGSVVAVGILKSSHGIDWRIFRNIVISWLVTLPVAGIIAMLLNALFLEILKI